MATVTSAAVPSGSKHDGRTAATTVDDVQASKRPRLEAVQINSTAHQDNKGVNMEVKPMEDASQCAETGDMPLPASQAKVDLEPIRQLLAEATPPRSTSTLDFRHGLFLAPMVRIGSLPTRLLSLQYGADLVWSPEIVDRAIYDTERKVNAETGLITYSRFGKHIFTTHPIERARVIFQLGSASPEWAYKAIKDVTAHDDVAGVDLNCGCPKPFSTIGGMGAQLLSTPDLLCDVLRAMRIAAPPHVAVSCKIRLLPTKEETQALVRKIIRTGCIDALTVHCRTKTMRPREAALPDRLDEVRQVVQEETGGALPLIVNGDAWDANEAQNLMQRTGVTATMMARGPEGNPSCFQREGGVLSVPEIVGPAWVRLGIALDNQYANTKYCVQSMAFKPSSSVMPDAPQLRGPDGKILWNKAKLHKIRSAITASRSLDELAAAVGVDAEEVRRTPIDEILKDVREALERRKPAALVSTSTTVTPEREPETLAQSLPT